VIEYLVKNGVMEPSEMYEAPFTHFHDMGLSGVMGDELAKKVVSLVERIRKNASGNGFAESGDR